MLAVVAVLGLVVVPTFANGGFGFGPGAMVNSLSDEDYTKWLEDQVEDGWITQKQADYMLEMRQRNTTLQNEEEYNAYIDQQLEDGWVTEKQAEYLKERYQLYKENYSQNGNATFMMRGWGGRGYGCLNMNGVQGGFGRGYGRRGGRGMMGGGRGW